LWATTVSVVAPPSDEPTSEPAVSPASWLSAELTVRTSSLYCSCAVELLGVQVIVDVNVASNLS